MESKWTAKELLESLLRECNNADLRELYKAQIAYESGATEIDNKALDKLLDWYYNNDNLTSIINSEILDKFQEILEEEN